MHRIMLISCIILKWMMIHKTFTALSPFYSNAHRAVRILLFVIENTSVHWISKSGPVRIRIQSGLCTEKLMSVQCNFPRAKIFLTAIKSL